MARKEVQGRTHVGRIPDDPLQDLPDFIEAGESPDSLVGNNVPMFVPVVRMDKPWLLRKMKMEDLASFAPRGNGINESEIKYGWSSSGYFYDVTSGMSPSSGWLDSYPVSQTSPGTWNYVRVQIFYDNGNIDTFYSISRIGLQGPQGPSGTNGTNGSPGDPGVIFLTTPPTSSTSLQDSKIYVW